MNDYLIDQEVLEEFIDELLKHQALPVDSPEELTRKREEAIRALDDKIGLAIFSRFTEEQGQEYEQLLGGDDVSAEDCQAFFDKIGLDVDTIISDTMQEFAKEFLGGKNA